MLHPSPQPSSVHDHLGQVRGRGRVGVRGRGMGKGRGRGISRGRGRGRVGCTEVVPPPPTPSEYALADGVSQITQVDTRRRVHIPQPAPTNPMATGDPPVSTYAQSYQAETCAPTHPSDADQHTSHLHRGPVQQDIARRPKRVRRPTKCGT